MAYKITHSEPDMRGDPGYVDPYYDIPLRPSYRCGDAEHLQKIEEWMSEYRHKKPEGKKPKEGGSVRGKER